MGGAWHSAIPSQDQLEALSVRLMREYQPRFEAANMDHAIGRVRSMISRGIGVEINGDWHSFNVGRWSFLRRHRVLANGLNELEGAIWDSLEATLQGRTFA